VQLLQTGLIALTVNNFFHPQLVTTHRANKEKYGHI
jgi:hypothetical protein